ncbi:uncharacterized protein I303_103671 [Kwoniella dejecticola CBS 10117]|uniref:DNA-(apurinic or apyrimidinic site) lyase n=1 Tax=Kwoniella dejecticola CBS 10117 TaxID=1296121 RepID=A0AAJ8KNU2_9TREE
MARPPFPAGWSAIPCSLKNLTLANTLPVGQSFLWHRHDLPATSSSQPSEEFSRAVNDPPRVVCLRQSPTHLYYTAVYPTSHGAEQDKERGVTKAWLEDYFYLKAQPNLEKLYEEWRVRDPDLFGKVEVSDRAVGVRVLRQDPWECLIAFITSTNNHIPRITSLLHRFSQAFSPPLLSLDDPDGSGQTTYHLFPQPSAIPPKSETLLRNMGFGYRAPFIESSLQTLQEEMQGNVEQGLLNLRREEEVDSVREKLVALKGVGRKVADCVMLMCMDKQFLSDKWGPMGGWCQAVMFAADLPSKGKVAKTEAPRDPIKGVSVKRKVETTVSVSALKRTRSETRKVTKMVEEVKLE